MRSWQCDRSWPKARGGGKARWGMCRAMTTTGLDGDDAGEERDAEG